jgi:4'-phosphopantetheinyl transferase
MLGEYCEQSHTLLIQEVEALSKAANEVDIWRINLAEQYDRIQQCRGLLSLDEVQRTDRYIFERDRRRFTVARAAMRDILSRYTGLAAVDLHFAYGPNGKPELAGGLEQFNVKFNLSHSSELALLAVTQGFEVGVDIEWINADVATDDIAERFFSASEVQTLKSLPDSQRVEAFFACWTRKEAYMKARGEGFSISLDSFTVAFAPGTPAEILHTKAETAIVEQWSMFNIEVSEGYKAALVVEGKDHLLTQMEWHLSLESQKVIEVDDLCFAKMPSGCENGLD